MVAGCVIARVTSPCFGTTTPTGRAPPGRACACTAVSAGFAPQPESAAAAASATRSTAGPGRNAARRDREECMADLPESEKDTLDYLISDQTSKLFRILTGSD